MNEEIANEAVVAVVSVLAFTLPLVGFMFLLKFTKVGADRVGNALKGGIEKIQKGSSNTANKIAKNSKYGQAAQQFLGQRKNIAALKGREFLREKLNQNPNLMMKGLGGFGGGKYAARFLDAEKRKQHAEDVENLQRGLSGNVATFGIAGKGNVREALQRGYWEDPTTGIRRKVTDQDRAAVEKLRTEGYMDSNYNLAKADPRLANAALGSIMDAELATPQNVRQLAGYLKGAGTQENALFAENLQKQAMAHKYKNLQYHDVSDGEVLEYYVKSGGPRLKTDGSMETAQEAAERGADSVLVSGLRGLNKDALDPSMDTSMLRAIGRAQSKNTTAEERRAYIVKIADQTRDSVEKGPVLEAVAKQLGTDATTLAAVQTSLRSGGASPMPAGFAPPPAPVTPPGSPPPSP